MEKTIDRTSYRRDARNEIRTVKKRKEKRFSYIKIFINQIIVSLLIISVLLTANYFDINFFQEWISENISDGYKLSEVVSIIKNMIVLKTNNKQTGYFSGDIKNDFFVSGDISGDNSGEKVFMTAVEGINQMLNDAKMVKEKYEIIIPVKGTITSEFGCRVSDNNIVSSYHTGLDIGAEKGTKIYAAHSGVVKMAKEFSSYGKCIMIEAGDLITVYAHCNSINVKQGQNIDKGDVIGEVGMTGNATGPHLHFEMRYQERYIDPKYIIGEV